MNSATQQPNSHPPPMPRAKRSRVGRVEDGARYSLRDAKDLPNFLDAFVAVIGQHSGVDAYSINLYQPADDTMLCARVRMPAALAGLEQTYLNYVFPSQVRNLL